MSISQVYSSKSEHISLIIHLQVYVEKVENSDCFLQVSDNM